MIKPNVQWWNQGAPNLLAVKTFVGANYGASGRVSRRSSSGRELPPRFNAMEINRFRVVTPIREEFGYARYSQFQRALCYLKKRYGSRFSVCHWVNVDAGGKRVSGPAVGNGYVYCDGTNGVPLISYNNGCQGNDYRAVIMTYPIMTTDKGTVIDFKNGIWKKGAYTGQPMKFINFAALNHHSAYCGATSAIKNYLGVTDLSGGPDPHNGGKLAMGYYNFHSFPLNKWAPGPVPGMLGAEIGAFMNSIRKADLNITTAEWTGLASRTDPPVAHTRAVLASKMQ